MVVLCAWKEQEEEEENSSNIAEGRGRVHNSGKMKEYVKRVTHLSSAYVMMMNVMSEEFVIIVVVVWT